MYFEDIRYLVQGDPFARWSFSKTVLTDLYAPFLKAKPKLFPSAFTLE